MIFSKGAVLLGVFVLPILASPQSLLSPLRRRADSPTPTIHTKIISPNGTDLTSSFRTVVYYEPEIVAPPSNLTGRGILTVLGRTIAGCRSKTAIFQYSKCLYEIGIPSMQGYLVYCQEPPRATSTIFPGWVENRGGRASTSQAGGHDPPIIAEPGFCGPDETCRGRLFESKGYSVIASCLKEEDYIESDSSSDEGEVLSGRTAQVVVTSSDGRMPLKMQTMNVEAQASDSSGPTAGIDGTALTKECSNCYELETKQFAPNTDLLRTQAKLMTTGAIAGIVWLTVLSG